MPPKTALETIVNQNVKDIDRHDQQIDQIKDSINEGMTKMVAAMEGLRKDMADRSERYIQLQSEHALEDTRRFGAMETKLAFYVGIGMCFAAFAQDIIKGIAGVVGHS